MGTRRTLQSGLGRLLVAALVVSLVVLRTSPTDAETAPRTRPVEPGPAAPTTSSAHPITTSSTVPAPPVEVLAATRPEATAPTAPTPPTPTTTTAGPAPAEPPAPAQPVAEPSSAPPAPAPLQDPLALARAEVGGSEARYTTGWGFAPGFWRAKFVSWVLAHAGVDIRHDGPAALRHLVPAVEVPVPGDLVFVDLVPGQESGQISHVGIVEAIHPDGSVRTIEGNADRSGLVTRQRRRGAEIVGFGRPPAPSSTTVIPAPAPPTESERVWIEIGKPWLCDWKPLG